MIEIFAIFAPIVLAPFVLLGGLAVVGRRRWPFGRGRWALFVQAALGVAAFAWVVSVAGYTGLLRELLLGLFAAAALALPVGLINAFMPDAKRPERTPAANSPAAFLGFLLLPLFVGVLFPWTGRVTWARKMAWSCDGVIVEKYRSHNHQAPTLVVRERDGRRIQLEGVSIAAWNQATTAEPLRKAPGHGDGLLNDRRVELVARSGW